MGVGDVIGPPEEPASYPFVDAKCTWVKYIVLSRVVSCIRIRDKRLIFHILRNHDETEVDENTFFPSLGFTSGEFAVFNILSDQKR